MLIHREEEEEEEEESGRLRRRRRRRKVRWGLFKANAVSEDPRLCAMRLRNNTYAYGTIYGAEVHRILIVLLLILAPPPPRGGGGGKFIARARTHAPALTRKQVHRSSATRPSLVLFSRALCARMCAIAMALELVVVSVCSSYH